MEQEIRRVNIDNIDFLELCKELDNLLNKIVAEQRYPNANCLEGLDRFNVYIMYKKRKPVGFVAFSNVINGVVEIGLVFVKEKYRCYGVATKLFEYAENIAKDQGAKSLILDTYERLESAMRLYKKLGFNIVPQFKGFENSPYSICMKKDLFNKMNNE